jgi:hypothetical protein
MKVYWGSRVAAPLILNLGARWSWLVNSSVAWGRGQSPPPPQCRLNEVCWSSEPGRTFWKREQSLLRAGIIQPIAYSLCQVFISIKILRKIMHLFQCSFTSLKNLLFLYVNFTTEAMNFRVAVFELQPASVCEMILWCFVSWFSPYTLRSEVTLDTESFFLWRKSQVL